MTDNENSEFTFPLDIRGIHVYRNVRTWWPHIVGSWRQKMIVGTKWTGLAFVIYSIDSNKTTAAHLCRKFCLLLWLTEESLNARWLESDGAFPSIMQTEDFLLCRKLVAQTRVSDIIVWENRTEQNLPVQSIIHFKNSLVPLIRGNKFFAP